MVNKLNKDTIYVLKLSIPFVWFFNASYMLFISLRIKDELQSLQENV